MFAYKTHLKSHLSSSSHRRLTVICPWCEERDKTFTRINDLEVHCNSIHPDIHVTKKVFSRQNGFFLAKYPKDYARIVGRTTPYESEEAYQARKAVRSWVDGFEDRKERMEDWNSGWKEGLALVSSSRSQSSDRRVVKDRGESSNGESEKATDEGNDRRGKSKSKDRGESSNGGSEKATDEGHDRRGKSKSKERRKSSERQCSEKDKAAEKKDEEPVKESERRNDGNKEKSIKDVEERNVKEKDTRVETEMSKEGTGQDGDVAGNGKRKREESTVKEASKCARTEEEEEEDGLETYQDNIDLGEEAADEENKETEDKEEETDKTEMVVGPEGRREDENSESGSSTTSASTSSSKAIIRGPDGYIKDRAYRILQRGCMPVCPPAKREWGVVSEFDLGPGLKLDWPPPNWRKLSADQRLLAHEFAAMFVEKNVNKTFPLISRRVLLDKYQFMCLNGEGKPMEEENAADKIDAKIRLYNFSYVKGVVKGEIEASRVSWGIIKTIERADRWTDADKITDLLDKHGLKIRV